MRNVQSTVNADDLHISSSDTDDTPTTASSEEESSSSEDMNDEVICKETSTPRTSSTVSSRDSVASSDDTCMICMLSVRDNQRAERTLQMSSSTDDLLIPLMTDNLQDNFLQSIKPCDCNYTVHARCLIQWYSRQPICPICRTKIITRNRRSTSTISDEPRRVTETDTHPETNLQTTIVNARICLERIGYCIICLFILYIILVLYGEVPSPQRLNITMDSHSLRM